MERTIDGMLEGESGYTVPEAMMVDLLSRCFLNGHYTVHDAEHGAAKMKVARKSDGYHVWMKALKRHWPLVSYVPWEGVNGDDLIPVVQAH